MKDVLPLLNAELEIERAFLAEAKGKPGPAEGWSPAMMFFHLALWRERLWNALASASEGRPVDAPQGNIDELNNREMEGAGGVSLEDAASRSDAALTSLIAMLDAMGDVPFRWYTAETVGEAVVRNSYIHPRIHLADQLLRSGHEDRSRRLVEESATEMRRAGAPGHILGAALYNLAGVRAAQGRVEEALNLLEEALPMRPDLTLTAVNDNNFAPLRETPRFRALIEKSPS